MGTEIKDSKKAFEWIIRILRKHKVSFQISGGLAAQVYGSERSLYDIDIEMSDEFFEKIIPDVKNHIVFGPRRNISDSFEVQLLRLNYKGQEIDLSGTDEKMFDKKRSKWIKNNIDLSKAVSLKVFNLIVPVISKEALIAYKEKTRREVDIIDIKQMK